MKKKGFSLLEMLVIVVIVGVLAVLGLYSSQNFFETAKDKTCRANLMVLKQALDFYILDHDVFPINLVQIPQKYIDRAYAAVLPDDHSWQAKLGSFIESLKKEALVYAQPFINTLSPRDMGVLSCPKDPTPPNPAILNLVSYGILSTLSGQSIRVYQSLTNTTLVIGDCDNGVFTGVNDLERRHTTNGPAAPYALVIQKDDTVIEQ